MASSGRFSSSSRIDLIEIKWPTTQQVEKFTNVDVNQILTIKEGAGIIAAQKIPPLGLK